MGEGEAAHLRQTGTDSVASTSRFLLAVALEDCLEEARAMMPNASSLSIAGCCRDVLPSTASWPSPQSISISLLP